MPRQTQKIVDRRAAQKCRPAWHPRVPPRDPEAPSLQAILRSRAAALAWPLLAFCMLLAPFRPAAAAEQAPLPGDAQGGSLLFRLGAGFMPAALVDTDVSISVNGLVAHVSVMQEFRNTGPDWVEGIYVFPLPDAAAVNRMRLYVGDRFIEAEIREREQARREYEAAKQSGRKTSLVEQQRANLFTTSVANVGPGETVIVEIEYLEELQFKDGLFSLRFPMTLTPRYAPGDPGDAFPVAGPLLAEPAPPAPPVVNLPDGQRVSLRATINAGLPLDIVASRYHAVHVSEAGGSYAVTLAGGQLPMDRDFELLWRPLAAATPRALAFAETVAGDTHYLLLVVPPEDAAALRTPLPRELVFVVDTSGSMHGVSIEQAKQALGRALSALRPGDLFNVIEFNSSATALFTASAPADDANVRSAAEFVARLRADGGTEMRSALELALAIPAHTPYLRQIVFITDGAVGNEEDLFAMISRDLGDTRLFTVGIGSAPNGWFMRKAAESGRGTYTFIGDLNEVAEKMDRLFAKLGSPQVTNIEVLWPGTNAVEAYPATVPDLYLGEPVAIRARLSGTPRPGETVRISGSAAAGAWTTDVELAGRGEAPGVATLWARQKITELFDAERRGADPDATRAAVVETALRHRLVSKYTSLVAVDKTPVRASGEPLASKQVANRVARGQAGVSLTGFAPTATAGPLLRLAGLLALAAALLLAAVAPRTPVASRARAA